MRMVEAKLYLLCWICEMLYTGCSTHMTNPTLLQVISQTAIQEFKQGSAERGRSMFESCLRNYPTRLDVWSQYLDQASFCEAAMMSVDM